MIRLKDLLSEKVTDVKWVSKAYMHAARKKFPFTPKIAKILNEGKRVRAFHITSITKLDQLDSLQGTKKSISCMARIPNSSMRIDIPGIWNSGVMFYLEGTLLIKGDDDIMSEPDEQGRRWAELHGNIYLDWFEFLEKDSKLRSILDDMNGTRMVKYYTSSEKSKEDTKLRGEILRKYVERYIQLAEKFAEQNKSELANAFIFDRNDDPDGWDELLLNDIKLIDVIWGRYVDGQYMMDDDEVNKVKSKLKSMISGKVIFADDSSDIRVFVMKGKVRKYNK
jgi:hypothetical protein